MARKDASKTDAKSSCARLESRDCSTPSHEYGRVVVNAGGPGNVSVRDNNPAPAPIALGGGVSIGGVPAPAPFRMPAAPTQPAAPVETEEERLRKARQMAMAPVQFGM